MDYHDALLREIRSIRQAERIQAIHGDALGDWQYFIDLAGKGAAKAIEHLGGMASEW